MAAGSQLVPWAFHGQPSPVQSVAVHCSPPGPAGLGWPDVKKVRSEAQSYIRRFPGPAIEPCCLLLLPELRAPSRSTGTQAGLGLGLEGEGQGRGRGARPMAPEAESTYACESEHESERVCVAASWLVVASGV